MSSSELSSGRQTRKEVLFQLGIPIRLLSAQRKLNRRAQLPLTHGDIPWPSLQVLPFAKRLEGPWAQGQGPVALNEGALQEWKIQV